MANGFRVDQFIPASPDVVWRHLTDFENAGKWMPGVDGLARIDDGPLAVGSILKFNARGKVHESRISALVANKKLGLTSTQGGVTAVYLYELAPVNEGTQVTLSAGCEAVGFWKLLKPVINLAMKKADQVQLARLEAWIVEGD